MRAIVNDPPGCNGNSCQVRNDETEHPVNCGPGTQTVKWLARVSTARFSYQSVRCGVRARALM